MSVRACPVYVCACVWRGAVVSRDHTNGLVTFTESDCNSPTQRSGSEGALSLAAQAKVSVPFPLWDFRHQLARKKLHKSQMPLHSRGHGPCLLFDLEREEWAEPKLPPSKSL